MPPGVRQWLPAPLAAVVTNSRDGSVLDVGVRWEAVWPDGTAATIAIP
ncbi:MAG: hypothetical protein HC890_02655 [Chloroflexaceae bacterium]|nr:hypothetical protein [Chloroflexaceae bacterium]